MTGMITMLKGREHEDEDDALKLITGTGKPVLILCKEQMDKDVSKRGQNWLAFWRQNYLAVTIDEATDDCVTDGTAEAYEKIKLSATSTLVSKALKDEVWTSSDGTVWTLVSVSVSDFPSLYEEAADEYILALEEKRVTTLEKLDNLIVSLGVEESDGSITLTSDALLLKEKAERKADEIISGIDRVEKGLRIDEVVEKIRHGLNTRGFNVN